MLTFSIPSVGIAQTFKSFDGTNIAYTDQGEGLPVVLIHGFISSGSAWNKSHIKKQLLTLGYRVIVPDLRGNGNSDKPHDPRAYQNDAEIKDLMALCDHLKLSQYAAIGYSRGAIVLAKLLTADSRIKKAVLGGMGIDFTNPKWPRRIMFEKAFAKETPLNEITKGAVNYANSIGADLQILSLLQKYQPVTSKEALNQLDISVLVIAGDQDTDNGSPSALQSEIPGSRLKIIPGNHNETYKSVDFSNAIISFLK